MHMCCKEYFIEGGFKESIASEGIMDHSSNALSFSSHPLQPILIVVLVQFGPESRVGPKTVYPSELLQINSWDLNFRNFFRDAIG